MLVKNRKPKDYWRVEENAVAEARKVMEEHELDSLPNKDKLCELGHSGLSAAISKYHGGYHEFRKILGEKEERVKNGLWKDLDFTLEQAIKIMDEHGFDKLPTQKVLGELGYNSFGLAISRHHGGFPAFRKLLGEKVKEIPNWKDENYALEQARKIMDKHGFDKLPNQNKLEELGYSNLGSAINRHYGGFRKFRELLGEKQLVREHGLWKSLDYTIEQAERFMKEHPEFDVLPSQKKLGELGYSSLVSAIGDYHGGMYEFRKLLGEKQIRRKPGSWRDLDFTIEQAKKVMKDNGFNSLPSAGKLNELKCSSLVSAINSYHGGFTAFRAKLNDHSGVKSEKEKLEELLGDYASEK